MSGGEPRHSAHMPGFTHHPKQPLPFLAFLSLNGAQDQGLRVDDPRG